MLIEEINKLIKLAKDKAPDSVSNYVNLHPEQAKEFWETIEYLALRGNKEQRRVAFTVLRYGHHRFPDKKLDQLVKEIESCDFGRKKHILWYVLWIIVDNKRTDLIPFQIRVRDWAIKVSNESVHHDVVDCLLELDWKKVQQDILQYIKSGEDRRVVNTIGRFIYLHGKKVYKEFYLSLAHQDKTRLDDLKEQIHESYEMDKRAMQADAEYRRKYGIK